MLYVASYTSDALEILKLTYNSTNPTLIPVNAFNYLDGSEILSFTETL
jgi:hypothetical protein